MGCCFERKKNEITINNNYYIAYTRKSTNLTRSTTRYREESIPESKEYTTLVQCTPKLEAQLQNDRDILHALYKVKLIGEEAYNDALNPRSMLSNAQKAGAVVRDIKRTVFINNKKYDNLLQAFNQKPEIYGGIVEILNKQYGASPLKSAAPDPAVQKKKPAVKKAPSSHPPYSEMIIQAITALKESKGSSRQSISKYIKSNYNIGDNSDVYLKTQLKRMVESGKLIQTSGRGASGSFKIVTTKKQTKAKATAKKASTGKTTKIPKAFTKTNTTKLKKVDEKPTAKKISAKKLKGKPTAKNASTGTKVTKPAATAKSSKSPVSPVCHVKIRKLKKL